LGKKKYQIFVSATFRDLQEERQDAIRSILDLDQIPSGMELFPATDEKQFEYIKQVIDECDYYLLIIGGRYGSVDDEGISYTEKEYDYAVENGKMVLGFIHSKPRRIELEKSETDPKLADKLEEFKVKVSTGRLVKYWSTRNELEPLVAKTIARAMADYPMEGWIRGSFVQQEALLLQVDQLRSINDELRKRNRELEIELGLQTSDLSGMNEPFSIRYEFQDFSEDPCKDRSQDITLAWTEIFLIIGPEFTKPTQAQVIQFSLAKYIMSTGNPSSGPLVIDEDVGIIKRQLMSMGLLRSRTAQKETGITVEFLELTPAGRSKLINLLAQKASRESEGGNQTDDSI
jgi:hypothetical protein